MMNSSHNTYVSVCFITDINECNSTSHGCEHECNNTIGSFECTCTGGYELDSDGVSCVGEEIL